MSEKYATNTSVSVERSRGELERLLTRYGSTGFGYVTQGALVAVEFQIFPTGSTQRRVQFKMEMPDPNNEEFIMTPSRRSKRTNEQALQLWEKACRAKWRALLLVVKAKLEAVEAEISTFDKEFLAHLLTGDGRTVYQHVEEQLPALEAGGAMLMLPGGAG